MNIENYTGHTVRYFGPKGEVVFEPEGDIQLTYEMQHVGTVEIRGKPVRIVRKVFKPESIPKPKPNTYYIVATLVAAAFPDRDDLISPSDSIRDKHTGEVIGCGSFSLVGGLNSLPGKLPVKTRGDYNGKKEEEASTGL